VTRKNTAGRGSLIESLRLVARLRGQDLSAQSMTAGLPLKDGDLTPSTFDRAARRCGFTSRVVQQRIEDLNPLLLPAILLMEGDRACVVHSLDAQSGRAAIVHSELPDAPTDVAIDDLTQEYSGTLIYCRPEFRAERNASNTPPPGEHWFWSVIRDNRHLYRDVLLAAGMINLFALASPLFIMNVYDRVVPNHATHTLWVLSAGMLIVLLADLGIRLMRNWFVDLAASRSDLRLSSRLLSQVLGLRLSHRPESAGAFASNLQSYEAIRGFFSSFVVVALIDLPFVLLFVIVIGIINAWLMIPIVVGTLLVLGYALLAQQKLRELSDSTQQVGAQRNALLVESISNLEAVKCFSAESRMQAMYERATLFLASVNTQLRLISASVSNGAQWVQHMTSLAIILIGVYAIIAGDMSQGGLIAAYLLSSRAMAPVSQAAGLLAQYHQAASALKTLDDIMHRPIERPDGAQWVQRPVLKGEIEFRNVSFSYPGDTERSLTNVSFRIKAGEHVAILGRNGSGKSTLEKLLMGLYTPDSGAILVDGVDLRQLDPADLRHNIGYVPQDIQLFQGSLRDNIVVSCPQASDQELLETARISGLASMTDRHPEGFGMLIGENGQRLSGGQRQTLAIARALINDPPILLLDEPTGALDHSSEDYVKHHLANLAGSKTLIVITHRTAMLELTDRMLVMDNGKIVADGPKKEVVEALRQGRIWSAQT
jgi:ATP-binding cassette, subfamily C, bacterial LapB